MLEIKFMNKVFTNKYTELIYKLTEIIPINNNFLITEKLPKFLYKYGNDGIDGLIGFIKSCEIENFSAEVICEIISGDLMDYQDEPFPKNNQPYTFKYKNFSALPPIELLVNTSNNYHLNYYNSEKD